MTFKHIIFSILLLSAYSCNTSQDEVPLSISKKSETLHDLSYINAFRNGGIVTSSTFCLEKIKKFWQSKSNEPVVLINDSKNKQCDLKNLSINLFDTKDLSKKCDLDLETGIINLNIRYYKLLKYSYLKLKNPYEEIPSSISYQLSAKLHFKKVIQCMLLNQIITTNFINKKSIIEEFPSSLAEELSSIESDFFQGFYYGSTNNFDSFKKFEKQLYENLNKIRHAECSSYDLGIKKTNAFFFGIYLAEQKDDNYDLDQLKSIFQKFVLNYQKELNNPLLDFNVIFSQNSFL